MSMHQGGAAGTRGLLTDRAILLVEDDEDGGAMMKLALERQGAKVWVADCARAAERLLKETRFDGIVCDIGLPDEDGHAFMRRVRGSLPAIPAVALTGFSSVDDARSALDAGFDMHVAKPVDPFDLAQRLAKVIREPQARG
jgi:CheY-like chemotaxis protein